jgi:tRNA-dihydrouridine synthase
MIGRGALGNPWLFAQINDLLAGRTPTTPTREVVRDDILRHMRLMERRYGDPLAARMMRSHFAYYSRGRFGARDFRQAANAADTLIEQEALVRFHFDRDEAAA